LSRVILLKLGCGHRFEVASGRLLFSYPGDWDLLVALRYGWSRLKLCTAAAASTAAAGGLSGCCFLLREAWSILMLFSHSVFMNQFPYWHLFKFVVWWRWVMIMDAMMFWYVQVLLSPA
jgi:hypothetical protein